MTFPPTTPSRGETPVAGLWWRNPDAPATTAVLAVHGSGGSRDDWGPVRGAPGYSLAHRLVASGRDVVAVDLPGYGASPAPPGELTMERLADAVARVAAGLRRGRFDAGEGEAVSYGTVVGQGLSMGGLLVEIAQGVHGAFDALAVAGWSHEGFSAAYRRCLYHGEGCPEPPWAEVWHPPGIDPAVRRAIEAKRPNRLPPAGRTSIHAWGGLVFRPLGDGSRGEGEGEALPPEVPRLDDVLRRVEVPVLLQYGALDVCYDPARFPREPGHLANAPTVDLHVVPETGHFVRWHRTNDAVDARELAWLDAADL